MTDVFVSYSSDDRAAAAAVVEALERQGWTVFWDRTIPAGKKWPDVLQQRLDGTCCTLLLLTRDALRSSWVNYEASVALHRRTLVPLLIEPGIDPGRELPEMYRDLHVASISPESPGLNRVGLEEPWMRAIRDLVVQGRRRRRLRLGARLSAAALALLAVGYVAVTVQSAIVDWQAGLRHVERGPYTKAETERLKQSIREATSIDVVVVNASSFASTFREDLAVFFASGGKRLRMLMADPDSAFYQQMMAATTPGIDADSKASTADKAKIDFSKRAILSAAGRSAAAVEFRRYDTQFRVPVILIDDRYCFITLRLTPDQAQESLRFELASPSAGTPVERAVAATTKALGMLLSPSTQKEANIASCVRHFDAIWKNSKPFD